MGCYWILLMDDLLCGNGLHKRLGQVVRGDGDGTGELKGGKYNGTDSSGKFFMPPFLLYTNLFLGQLPMVTTSNIILSISSSLEFYRNQHFAVFSDPYVQLP